MYFHQLQAVSDKLNSLGIIIKICGLDFPKHVDYTLKKKIKINTFYYISKLRRKIGGKESSINKSRFLFFED